jgi:hypothetical protein
MAETPGNGPSGSGPAAIGEPRTTLRYRILRYMPNLNRDEWINIGVLVEDMQGGRKAMRVIEEPRELARVWRSHPDADEDLLRSLPAEFDARLRAPANETAT